MHLDKMHFVIMHFDIMHFDKMHFDKIHFDKMHFYTMQFYIMHFDIMHFDIMHFDNFTLKERFSDHKGYVANHHLNKATGFHFNLPGHKIHHMTVTILEKIDSRNP